MARPWGSIIYIIGVLDSRIGGSVFGILPPPLGKVLGGARTSILDDVRPGSRGKSLTTASMHPITKRCSASFQRSDERTRARSPM